MKRESETTSARARRSTRGRLVGAAVAMAIVGSATLAACGGDQDGSGLPATWVEAFESPYCVTARAWAVHELDGGGDGAYARGGPKALEMWWAEQLAYLETSLRQAPAEVRDAEAVNERFIRTRLTPLVRRYGFDAERVAAEASAVEKALADHPPATVAKAQEVRNLYQDRFCGYGGQPRAAAVTFPDTAAARPYCDALARQQDGLDEIAASGFDPELVAAYATSGRLDDALEEQNAKAPPEIAADVELDNEWGRTRQLEVWEKHHYDLRRVLLEGSAEDIAAFSYWDPAIRDRSSRVRAFREQVCGL